jgi:hypothetical protein
MLTITDTLTVAAHQVVAAVQGCSPFVVQTRAPARRRSGRSGWPGALRAPQRARSGAAATRCRRASLPRPRPRRPPPRPRLRPLPTLSPTSRTPRTAARAALRRRPRAGPAHRRRRGWRPQAPAVARGMRTAVLSRLRARLRRARAQQGPTRPRRSLSRPRCARAPSRPPCAGPPLCLYPRRAPAMKLQRASPLPAIWAALPAMWAALRR